MERPSIGLAEMQKCDRTKKLGDESSRLTASSSFRDKMRCASATTIIWATAIQEYRRASERSRERETCARRKREVLSDTAE